MKRLLEGQQLQRTVPPTAGRVEPVVHLPGGLTLDDRSCWQYPTMLVGNVGSGKSTLMEQIRRPVLAHADRVQDTVVIFAAKPDVLRCRRPGDPVISVPAPSCAKTVVRVRNSLSSALETGMLLVRPKSRMKRAVW